MSLGVPELLHPPGRVVSLVPSLTESLFDLGFGSALVGVTDYCILPAGNDNITRVGGPKDANPRIILSLQPDLVLANREENTKEIVTRLQQADVPVWLTFPKTVRESMDDLWALVQVFHSKNAALRLRLLEDSLKMTELVLADTTKKRYFCPIWQEEDPDGRLWWMTFNQDTYAADLLQICGVENGFAARTRKYPLAANWGRATAEAAGERDIRYPVVTVEDVLAMQPEIILLPDEPFEFLTKHTDLFKQLFANTPAVVNEKVLRLDGSLITWHGTRLGKALAYLPSLFSQ